MVAEFAGLEARLWTGERDILVFASWCFQAPKQTYFHFKAIGGNPLGSVGRFVDCQCVCLFDFAWIVDQKSGLVHRVAGKFWQHILRYAHLS